MLPAWRKQSFLHNVWLYLLLNTITVKQGECHLIPARTCNQTMILKSQHTLFAPLHSFQLNTANWHSHWARYQRAGCNLETMALGKEESKRKHKPLQDQAWRELHVYVPNQEVLTDLGITASLLSLPTGTESTVLRRNTAASNLFLDPTQYIAVHSRNWKVVFAHGWECQM